MSLDISQVPKGSATILRLKGRLTYDTATDFKQRVTDLVQSGARLIVLDFSGVAYLDSSALGATIIVHNLCERNGGSLRLFALQPDVMNIFEQTRLSQHFSIFPTEAEALGEPPAGAPQP